MRTSLKRIKNDMELFARYNSTPGKGLTRFSLTEEDRGARNYLKEELKKLDLEIYEDAAGSLFGLKPGTDPSLPRIMIGSHFDSVKNGGNFDGPAGVFMGLEIMRVLVENNIQTKYPIEFTAMIEEEGGRFGSGVFGSRAMAGMVDFEQLKQNKDENGISMAQAFKDFGFNPEKIKDAARKPDSIKAFIELHIEQGPVLESEKLDIGIVDYIVGINQFKVIIKGKPDHAGTTPMNMRADALSAAAKVIAEIDTYPAFENNGSVATVGVINIKPNAANIVPSEVSFTLDIRSRELSSMKNIKNRIIKALEKTVSGTMLSSEIVELLNVNPVKMDTAIMQMFKNNAEKCGFSYKPMMSGAGHDAMIMGTFVPSGLVFVPSKDGRSHCPEEWTDYEDLQKGIETILETVIELGEEVK